MTQITDLDAPETDTKRDDRNRSWPNDPPKPGLVDECLYEEIVALIPRLERYARVLTRDVSAAGDLVQDCLARALEKIQLWQPGTDLRAWLFTILHHQHISHTRRDAPSHVCLESQEARRRLVVSPDQMARLEFRGLERALARLPEQQRLAILLVGLEGMAYEEAASVVNIPVGTVRSRVARGRETLRAMTGLFPARHSRRPKKVANLGSPARPTPLRRPRLVPNGAISAPKSPEVVQ